MNSREHIVNRAVLPPLAAQRQITPPSRSGAPQQVGFPRAVPQGEAEQIAAARLQWQPIDGGTVAAFSITSPDAAAIRVSFVFQSLPAGTEIRFFSLGADRHVFGPFTLTDIRTVEVKDLAGGPSVFWSPVIEGDTAGVEIFVPAVGQLDEFRFTVGDVSHLFLSPTNRDVLPMDLGDSAYCEINLSCYSGAWGSAANAVAMIVFTQGGNSYLCSGTLLNDKNSSYTPYFLTANHCVPNASVASTINSFWFYQSATCQGTTPAFGVQQLTRGATLLSTATYNDFTFLVLNESAPGGVTFAGWTTADPSPGASATGIHHPKGDLKKISLGAAGGITGLSGYGANGFHQVTWSAGMMEGGSSGSPLFNAAQQVVGQLWGGQALCYASTSYYGRFALTFPSVKQWLFPSPAVSLTSSVAFPVAAGASLMWTATGSGGTAPYSYQFWLFDGTAWSMVRDWSASNTWTWQPSWPGSYSVQVWMRNAGSSSSYDAFGSAGASISSPSVLTVTAVTPSTVSVAAGTAVTWTATALGGPGPYTYKFHVYDGTGWTVGQDWSASNAWAWTPPAAGTFSFQVWVRNAGSAAALDAWRSFGPYTAVRPSLLAVTSFSSDLAAPKPSGTPVRWTATAAGGTGPYTYKFYVYDGSSWSIGQDWSGANSWTWTPPNAGPYALQVWVRNSGSSAPLDAWRANSYTVSEPVPLSVTGLAPDRVFPVAAGTPVRWTAGAIGGSGPYTYKFYVWDGASWSIGRDWGQNGWAWVPPAAGTYFVQVWVRNAGSVAVYDGWRGAGPVAVSAGAPLSVASLVVAPGSPLVVGGPAVIAATGVGGTGPYTYQFWVYNGSSWTVGQSWSASDTFAWTPPSPGTYTIQVWVRNAGSAAAYDAWASSGAIIVVP